LYVSTLCIYLFIYLKKSHKANIIKFTKKNYTIDENLYLGKPELDFLS
jgi:hypothetical protein